ncbi:MAG: AIM24 family protein [Pirellulales bacterium]
MRHEVLHGPAFSALRLDLPAGESVLAQPGAMLAMTPGFTVEVRAGMITDLPLRQVLVVSSEIYAEIDIPTAAFGLVSAASALLGLAVAGPLRRLALGASARANGLAVNVGYGLGCLAFAAATAASARIVGEANCFRAVVGLLPWGFLLVCVAFAGWSRRLGVDQDSLVRPGGFGEPRHQSP